MILYFTGTGNSKYAAELLSQGTGDELVSLNNVLKRGETPAFHSEKPFVIVCPIYAWRLPRCIEDLLRRAEFSGSSDVYFVATMGAQTGNCHKYCEKLARQKGLSFRGFSGVAMPSNYVVASMPDEAEVRTMLTAAKPALEALARKIAAGETIEKTDHTPCAALMSGAVNAMFNRFAVGNGKYVVSERCVSCGKCAEFCPTNNIVMKDKRPSFGSSCMSCFGCINRCPQDAIDIKGKSEGHRRYVCPESEI
jgi:Fe-S-cluster-containing hydrogenase component 2